MTSKFICTSFLFAAIAVSAERGEEIKLWPNGAPGSEGITAPEVSKPSTSSAQPPSSPTSHCIGPIGLALISASVSIIAVRSMVMVLRP